MSGEQLRAGGGTYFTLPNLPSSQNPDGVWIVDVTTDQLSQASGGTVTYWDYDPVAKEYFPKGSNINTAKSKLVFKCYLWGIDGCIKWTFDLYKRDKIPGPWSAPTATGTFVRI